MNSGFSPSSVSSSGVSSSGVFSEDSPRDASCSGNSPSGVSIVIPHYKTESLAKLCLRSIRHYTRGVYEVIVVDNASGQDPALAYLRQVKWIRLIERDAQEVSKDPAESHKEAMDIGIAASKFPYILSLHTDSIVVHPQWLEWMLKPMHDPLLAASGTYKLEIKSPWQLWLKRWECFLGLGRKSEEGSAKNPHYIRSHCALYRKEALEKLQLGFRSPETAGRNIHFGLKEAGYTVKLLPVEEMLRYVVHLNHGTMVINPELGARPKTIRQGMERIERFVHSPAVQKIYQDSSLDG